VLDRLGIDEFEMDDEIRPEFPCPYCYEDHDVTSLCAHLEEEHPFESRAAVRCTSPLSMCLWFDENITLETYSKLLIKHPQLEANIVLH
jgi:Drought induced 19 protein (Di19), zinc-binding